MLILNGKKFARTDAEFTASLFQPGGTCVGFYKPTSRQIFLMNQHKERIGVIAPSGVLGSATRLEDGRYWYSYGTPGLVGNYESYAQEHDESHAALRQFCNPARAIAA